MKIVVASKNPVKINSTLEAFQSVFPNEKFDIKGISVPSKVSDQPMSEEETMKGALNRAGGACRERPDADFWVGIEGGIQKIGEEMMAFAWVYIKGKNIVGKGRSASYFLPFKVVDIINKGKELGDATDIIFDKDNVKQKEGAIGVLTNQVITRTTFFVPPIIMALIPFRNKNLYK